MNAALSGRDVYVLMPTGGGKSRCYQLPAVVSPGVSIVITPLVSLLKDQLQHLAEANIPAHAFTGGQGWEEQRDVYDDLRTQQPRTKIVFVTPEKACCCSVTTTTGCRFLLLLLCGQSAYGGRLCVLKVQFGVQCVRGIAHLMCAKCHRSHIRTKNSNSLRCR